MSGKIDGNSSGVHLKVVHVVIAIILWVVVFALAVFVLVKAFSTATQLNEFEKRTRQNIEESDYNDMRQLELIKKLNSSINKIQNEIDEHERRLGGHDNSISELNLENSKQGEDLNDLRNRSQETNQNLNKSISDRMQENFHHIKSAQQLNDSVNNLIAENIEQSQFSSNLSDHVDHLENQQNVSSIQFVLETLEKNQILQQLNTSIISLQTKLNSSVSSLDSKNRLQDSNLTIVNAEIDGLVGAINHCESNTCVHGICQVQVNNYTCHCDVEYMGRNCSIGRCNEGWRFYQNFCYQFVRNERRNWRDAETDCVRGGGHLASILNQNEDNFVKEYIRISSWIGLSDRFREGNYLWSDNSRYSYNNWALGEPGDSNGREDCVYMWKERTYTWNDDRCTNSRPYICKARAKGL